MPATGMRRAEQLRLADDVRSSGRSAAARARGRRRGRAARRPSRASSMSSSIVREAFETSVTCSRRRSASRRATSRSCRRRARPRRRRCAAAATRASSPRSTGRGRGPCARGSAPPAARAQRSAVRRSCQTIAGWIGVPVRRVPDERRLALVRDPDRGELGGADAARRPAPPRPRRRRSARSPPGRAPPSPGRGKCCCELPVAAADDVRSVVVHDEARRAGRALVDREEHRRP